jgi:adenylate cyclase
MILSFPPFRLDVRNEQLWREQHEIPLRPKTFAILRYLAEHPHQLVTKEELLRAVWGDTQVSEDGLRDYLREIRSALNDDPDVPQFIETIRARGYRFIASLSIQDSTLSTDVVPVVVPLPSNPAIAVLPFTDLSDDSRYKYFGYGLFCDLITDLSKLPGLVVISRQSTLMYKDKLINVQTVSKELGVRYVVEGSVRMVGDHLLITAQLVDGITGRYIWAERYDRFPHDLFAMQEEIRRKLLVHIGLKLTPEEEARLQHLYTPNLEAYNYYAHALDSYLCLTPADNMQARQLCEQAIALDPSYAAAYPLMGLTYWAEWVTQWSTDPHALEQAFTLAQKALALDDSLPPAHELLGAVYLWRDKQHDQALAEEKRAIAQSPNWLSAYIMLAFVLNFAGRPEETIANAEVALRIGPRSLHYLLPLGNAYRLTKRYDEAIATFQKILTVIPHHVGAHFGLAIVYSELGREAEARAEAAEALRISPQFSLEAAQQRLPYKDLAELERHLAALRKAGLK